MQYISNIRLKHDDYLCAHGGCLACVRVYRPDAVSGEPRQAAVPGAFSVAELKVWGYVGLYYTRPQAEKVRDQ